MRHEDPRAGFIFASSGGDKASRPSCAHPRRNARRLTRMLRSGHWPSPPARPSCGTRCEQMAGARPLSPGPFHPLDPDAGPGGLLRSRMPGPAEPKPAPPCRRQPAPHGLHRGCLVAGEDDERWRLSRHPRVTHPAGGGGVRHREPQAATIDFDRGRGILNLLVARPASGANATALGGFLFWEAARAS